MERCTDPFQKQLERAGYSKLTTKGSEYSNFWLQRHLVGLEIEMISQLCYNLVKKRDRVASA